MLFFPFFFFAAQPRLFPLRVCSAPLSVIFACLSLYPTSLSPFSLSLSPCLAPCPCLSLTICPAPCPSLHLLLFPVLLLTFPSFFFYPTAPVPLLPPLSCSLALVSSHCSSVLLPVPGFSLSLSCCLSGLFLVYIPVQPALPFCLSLLLCPASQPFLLFLSLCPLALSWFVLGFQP